MATDLELSLRSILLGHVLWIFSMFILIHESIEFYPILEGLSIVSPGLLYHLVCSLIENGSVMVCRGESL